MTPKEDLSRFIASGFPSVWTLEMLLLLKRERRPWRRAELIDALRASDLVVTQALGWLVAAGLAMNGEEGAEYRPASEDLAKLIDAVETLYATRPDQVRRMMTEARSSC